MTNHHKVHLPRTIFHATALCQEQRQIMALKSHSKETFKLGVSWGRGFWMVKCVKDIWVLRRRGYFSGNGDLNFGPFLTRSDHIASEDLEYSTRVKVTYFIIILLFFCHYWSLTVKISLYFHCSLVILGFKKKRWLHLLTPRVRVNSHCNPRS